MRLTLIHPCIGRRVGQPYIRLWQMEPLPAATLAGLTPPDVTIRFYDDRLESIPFDEPADLVAIKGDALADLNAGSFERVDFVMKGGELFKNRLTSDPVKQFE